MDNLIEHLGINSINYFLYDERPQRDPTPHFSELLHLNKPVGLERMVSLKGGLRRVVIQQLRLLGNVRAQVIKASSSTNNRLSVWSRTLVRKPFPPSTDARAMLSTRP